MQQRGTSLHPFHHLCLHPSCPFLPQNQAGTKADIDLYRYLRKLHKCMRTSGSVCVGYVHTQTNIHTTSSPNPLSPKPLKPHKACAKKKQSPKRQPEWHACKPSALNGQCPIVQFCKNHVDFRTSDRLVGSACMQTYTIHIVYMCIQKPKTCLVFIWQEGMTHLSDTYFSDAAGLPPSQESP